MSFGGSFGGVGGGGGAAPGAEVGWNLVSDTAVSALASLVFTGAQQVAGKTYRIRMLGMRNSADGNLRMTIAGTTVSFITRQYDSLGAAMYQQAGTSQSLANFTSTIRSDGLWDAEFLITTSPTGDRTGGSWRITASRFAAMYDGVFQSSGLGLRDITIYPSAGTMTGRIIIEEKAD